MEEEIVTNPLSLDQLEKNIPEITNLKVALGTPVNVEYGWGCNLPTDQLWQTTLIDFSDLQNFIESARKSGIFKLGASDPHVSDLDGRWSFTLCHESDLHFVSSDRQLIEQIAAMWNSSGFNVQVSPYATVQGHRKWRKIDLLNQGPPTLQ